MIVHELCLECGRRKTVGEACTSCGSLDKPKKKPAVKKKARMG